MPKEWVRISNMAASTTGFSLAVATPELSAAGVRTDRRRRISHEAGRALEILGHAIEYLADEYVYEGSSLSANDPQLKAVQVLMALNRQIYFACPEVPTFGERWRSFLHARAD
jgi:hypothetical protein